MIPFQNKKPIRSFIIPYFFGISVVITAVLLLSYFYILPKISREIPQFPITQIKGQFVYVLIAVLTLLALFNLYIWRKDKILNEEATKAEQELKFNPQSAVCLDKLQSIHKKRERLAALLEPALILIIGAVVGFLAISLLRPLFEIGLHGPLD